MRDYMDLLAGDVEFFRELVDFYHLHKRRIRKSLRIRNDSELADFCADFRQMTSWNGARFIKHEYVCKLALIFSNILGRRLPDHLHARMVLGFSNDSCVEYCEYLKKLKPHSLFGLVNPNPNKFRMYSLSVNGMLSKLTSK